ncbi:MAG: hypothetical protein AB7I18_09965, partial [Candidatus Berkiella sp.]
LVVPLLQRVLTVLPAPNLASPLSPSSPGLMLRNLPQTTASVQKTVPTLIFPIDDTQIELEKTEQAFKAIPLTVSGGKRPYTWLIDGKPLQSASWQQKQFWIPKEPGYYTIAVIDANGQVDRANIEVR